MFTLFIDSIPAANTSGRRLPDNTHATCLADALAVPG
ncbi:hypothetical protein JOF53_006211 [Crossiella equi]|uniref:Uncharacterized protein n=1 Tax=Crossiella equi TaxID=130796 RepID=A0ABS5AMA4_9PSEU|nr:hypothetical protein [Crossiella equi]